MEKQIRNVLVLSSTQATLQITGATMIAVTGLAGFALADDKSFADLSSQRTEQRAAPAHRSVASEESG
jgi:hypothetical protein